MDAIILKNMHERELHPFLNYYLRNSLEIAAKTIYQERSINTTKGENEWIHPDMVGYSITTSKWNEKVVSLAEHYSMSKVILYSFELKKEITMSNLREVFFQAVSNSSWANEGYLVAVEIDTSNPKLMEKMTRLSNSFGIGIIKLELHDPKSSEIISTARRKEEIDGDTLNNLFEINRDFKEFLSDVENGVKINRVVNHHLDEVKSIQQLNYVLANDSEDNNIPENKIPDNNILPETVNKDRMEILQWSSKATGKKPKRIVINNEEIEADSWKLVYISFCQFLCVNDIQKFKATKLKGRKRPYFSYKDKDLRVAYYLEEAELYMEVNLSAQSIIKNIKSLMKEYNLQENDVSIIVEKNL